jgi:hypothetical protein
MDVGRHRCAVREANLLVAANADCRTISRGFALAAPNCDNGFISVGIDVETIIARLQDCERLVRRIHFIFFVVE